MRAVAGFGPEMAMTAWRGMSGRRYVASVHAAASPEIVQAAVAVIVALRRGRAGRAEPLGSAIFESDEASPARRAWIAAMLAGGASEMHVHLMAETPSARRAVLHDLGGRAEF